MPFADISKLYEATDTLHTQVRQCGLLFISIFIYNKTFHEKSIVYIWFFLIENTLRLTYSRCRTRRDRFDSFKWNPDGRRHLCQLLFKTFPWAKSVEDLSVRTLNNIPFITQLNEILLCGVSERQYFLLNIKIILLFIASVKSYNHRSRIL